MGSRVKPPATKPTLVQLYEDIMKTKYKLAFIKFKLYGSTRFVWALVQIETEGTDPKRTKKKGIYRCRWYGPILMMQNINWQGNRGFGRWFVE